MNSAPSELLKAYVNSQNFTSTTEVMEAMKDMFRDVIQQVMESELVSKISEKIMPEVNAWQNIRFIHSYSWMLSTCARKHQE